MIGYLDLWSNSLQGHVAYLDGETSITYYSQEYVDGADPFFAGGTPSLDLQGFVSCLDSGITTAEAESGDIYLQDAPDVMTPHLFEFHLDDLTLFHDTDGLGNLAPVGLAPGNAPTTGPNTWGMSSGPLVTAATAATLVNVYDVWNASEFYMYETGHNEWNQYVGLLDARPPSSTSHRRCSSPTSTPPRTTATPIRPTTERPSSWSTRASATCGASLRGGRPRRGRHRRPLLPGRQLVDGTPLVDAAGVQYVVKAVQVEQTLQEDTAYAGGLSLTPASSLPLPDGSGYVIPNIGPAPVINEAPRVLYGEVVTSP